MHYLLNFQKDFSTVLQNGIELKIICIIIQNMKIKDYFDIWNSVLIVL